MNFVSDLHSSLVGVCGEKVAFGTYVFGAFILWKLLGKIRDRMRAVSIRGSICVVSGASQGIGASIAEQLAAKGADKVILVSRTKSKLDAIAEKINDKYPDTAIVYPVDCSDYSSVEKMAQDVVSKHGIPRILVNCAGAGNWRYLWEMNGDDVVGCMNAPYFAAAFMSKAFVPEMIKKNYGTIVNVQSPAAHIGFGGCTAYMAGRWALRGLVHALRADLFPTKLRVQEVILGETKSEYFNNNPQSIERIPKIGRLAPAISADQAASAVISAIQSGADTYAYPPMLNLMMYFNTWMPSVIEYITIKTGWQDVHPKFE